MDANQQKTFLGIILVIGFGAAACCGLSVAVGAFVGYQDAVKTSAGRADAGPALASDPDLDDEALDADEAGLRDRFAAEVLTGLEEAGHPGYTYQRQRYELVADGGALIALGNLFDEYADQPLAARPGYVERTVRGFFPAQIPSTWGEARPNLVASVRDRIFVELLALRPEQAAVLHRPLADDLVEVVVYDGPDSMQYLTAAHLEAWGKNADEVFLEGRKQLASRSKEPFEKVSPGVFESPWADNHDIGRALLFDKLRKLKLNGDPVLFLPQRDHLLITGADDPAGLEAAGELVSEALELPRANSGRAWRLTKTGLVPFVPPAGGELLRIFRQEAEAGDANEQKKALDAKLEREGVDLFVATTLFTEDDSGAQHTYCVWTKGADSLLPKADFVVFVDIDKPEADRVIAAAPWAEVFKRFGPQMKADPTYWPLRYRVKTFPEGKALKALGIHPSFRREADE